MITEQPTQDTVVSEIPFEKVMEILNPLLNSICNKSNIPIPKEDLKQELLICLWKAYNKYPKHSLRDLGKIVRSSSNNRIVDLYRSQHREKSPDIVFQSTISKAAMAPNYVNIDKKFIREVRDKCSRSTAKIINMMLKKKRVPKKLQPEIEKAIEEIKSIL